MNRAEQRARSRAAILTAASERFLRNGYHATSLGDVASALGLVRGTVHFHFATKERLAETIAALLTEAFDDLADGHPPTHDDQAARAQWILRAFAQRYAEDVQLRAALRLAADAPDGSTMGSFMGRIVALVASREPGVKVAPVDARGTDSGDNAGSTAWITAAAAVGLLLTWSKHPGPEPLPELVGTLVDRLTTHATPR